MIVFVFGCRSAYHGHTVGVLGLSPYKWTGTGEGKPDSTHVVLNSYYITKQDK